MQAIDFNEIPVDGDRWALFARDFLKELGFHIEPCDSMLFEGTSDFCAIEQIAGKFNYHPFRWLVSPRHKASTRTAVKESEELDILDRVRQAKADGFLGFYSTPISPALSHALSELKVGGLVKDYKIIDTKLMESHLMTIGFSRILGRYFPSLASTRRPLHLIEDEYLPLPCDHCGKDLLESLFKEDNKSVVARIAQQPIDETDITLVHHVYFACMGACDESLQRSYLEGRPNDKSSVIPLAGLISPPIYLARILWLIDRLYSPKFDYTENALDKEKYLLRALAQRVMVDPTDGEILRAKRMMFGPTE